MGFFKPFFVVPTGVEPATPSLGNLCSIQLNYGTNLVRNANESCLSDARIHAFRVR